MDWFNIWIRKKYYRTLWINKLWTSNDSTNKRKNGNSKILYNTLNSQYPPIVEKSIRALVSIAEIESANICEVCGKYGETRTNGIIHTSCEEHKLENSLTLYEHRVLVEKHQAKRRAEKLASEYII